VASKKDNQLRKVETPVPAEESSAIIYAPEVVATIAGIAASEVEGIAGMSTAQGGKMAGKNKNVTRGVKVEVGPEEVSCDLFVSIEYGRPIQKVALEVQESVRRSLEAMTGLHVVRVDVHVQSVSFEKENNALTAGARNARLTDRATAGRGSSPAEEPAEKPAEKPEPEAAGEPVNKREEPETESEA
jgi:uncharacterized alkaline shock family protein YloU